jgi:integrase
LAVRRRLKLMAIDGSLQRKLTEESQAKAATFTYRQAVDEHWEAHLRNKKSASDLYQYLKKTISVFGTRDVSTITWPELETYRNNRLSEVSASYCRKELVMMGAVLDRQVKMSRLKLNPMKQVELPIVHDTRDRILTDEEFRNFLSVTWEVKNHGTRTRKGMEYHVRLALVIADFTAMRISEVLAMKWSEVDLDRGTIFIPQSKNGSKRQVPIHDELRQILAAEKRSCKYVINVRGQPVQSIRKGFIRGREVTGIHNWRIHDHRHRAITRWVQEGKPINVIMSATGHKTYAAFLRYSNLREGDVQTLVGRKTSPLPVISYEDFRKLP